MITMSIDASSKSSGVAIFENNRLIYHECITATNQDPITRIEKMVERMRKIFDEYSVQEIILEDVLPEDVRHNQNVFKILHYLQAAIVLEFHKNNIEIKLYGASEWRSRCGIRTGRGITRESLKQADINFVKKQYNIDVNDDVADAICLGWAHLNNSKFNNAQNESAF